MKVTRCRVVDSLETQFELFITRVEHELLPWFFVAQSLLLEEELSAGFWGTIVELVQPVCFAFP